MACVLKASCTFGTASKMCWLVAGSQQVLQPLLAPQQLEVDQIRGINKHWNPKFRWHRGKKMIKVELPDFGEEEEMGKMTPDELRKRMKEKGLLPPRAWQERNINLSSTGGVFEAYVPPEGDGKVSIISTTGAKQRLQVLEKKGKSMMSVRKIRSYDEDFDPADFAEQALGLYQKAHEALAAGDKQTLHDTVTELAYPKMMQNVRQKTVRWRLLRSLEPARVVHVRHTDLVTKENLYAQVTVRLHTQQLLAIYDRFGRLMYGSEAVAKDVLEYIVFEKHLSDEYGRWRLHSKIVPDWMPPREPVWKTWRKEPPPPKSEAEETAPATTSETAPAAATATAS